MNTRKKQTEEENHAQAPTCFGRIILTDLQTSIDLTTDGSTTFTNNDTIMTKIQLATKIWVMWCYNFDCPETFIGYICEKTGQQYLKDHLLSKWSHLYETFGCRSVMNDFYTDIDKDLQNALVDYAFNVYAPRGMKSTYEKFCNA